MKILFLDDDQIRHDELILILGAKHELVRVYHAVDAIDKLKTDQYDLVMLDHDLGLIYDEDGIADEGPDGRVVVRWMIENMKDNRPPVIVHSWNNQRAPEMEKLLGEAGFQVRRIAFARTWLKELL